MLLFSPVTCPLDPIPSHLQQTISLTLLPALTHINITPHWDFPYRIQAGLGNPAASKTHL